MEISIFFKPLPNADEQYLILTLALARSGLSLLLSSWPTNSELTGSSPAAGAASTSPEPPEAAASNAVVLTVMICEESLLDEFFLQGFPKFRLHFVFGTFHFLQVLTFASIISAISAWNFKIVAIM